MNKVETALTHALFTHLHHNIDKAIDFNAIDNMPVNIAILLIVPKNKLTQHIKTLANIAKMMNDNDLREKIATLKSPDAIIKAIKNY